MQNIYHQYTYNYPHKHTYRQLYRPIKLETAWAKEDLKNLFAYLHLPFCEMRCGFCNLFTISNPKNGVSNYLSALKREAQTYKSLLSNYSFEAYAIGGGTPTFLSINELAIMLSIFKNDLGVPINSRYGSIEASPKSLTLDKIQLIEQYGITRVSMGIQSWLKEETKLLGRPQSNIEVTKTVEQLIDSSIPELNLDLIYGIHGQTPDSWLYSLEKTVEYLPTEIFLYPLYQRPLTGLSKMQKNSTDNRLALYRIGRDFLLSKGYKQNSMRSFRRDDVSSILNQHQLTKDGTIGLGAGARSYTKELHYSSDYAVSRKATKTIIHNYSMNKDFSKIQYGIYLNKNEQQRRYLIKGLMDGGKINVKDFEKTFGYAVFDIPIIQEWLEKKWLMVQEDNLGLTILGMELEDYLGPLLFSTNVKTLMSTFELH